MNTHVSRRSFLKTVAAVGTVSIAVAKTPHLLAANTTALPADLAAILRYTAEGKAIIGVPVPDMGQGMITTAAQMVADELYLKLEDVTVELMPFVGNSDEEGKAAFGRFYQGTGGSLSTARIWGPLRQSAAYLRALLVEAAAKQSGFDADSFTTTHGYVIHSPSGQKYAYQSLVANITPETAPDYDAVIMRPQADRKLVGKPQRNIAAKDIATGKPLYGIDQDVPGMLHAAIKRCPHLKGDLVRHNGDAVRAMPGVQAVIEMPRLPADRSLKRLVAAGVAVVADSYWHAKQAAEALEIEWDGSFAEETDTALLKQAMLEAVENADMEETVVDGDAPAMIAAAAQSLEATYYAPNWAHACMEPHNCIADIREDSGEIWCGHQFMNVALNAAAEATGLAADKIKGNFFRIGTGFGRKFEKDYVQEACYLSQQIKGPVKVTWSREAEMEQDFVNHTVTYRLKGGLDETGQLTAMHVRVAAAGSFSSGSREVPAGLLDHYLGEWTQVESAISNGAWRGPGSNTRAWATQSFLDEAAHLAGIDPIEFQIALFQRKSTMEMRNWPYVQLDLSRHVAALEKVRDMSGWGKALPEGRGRGVAIFQTHHSLCAHVVEVSMTGDKGFTVEKVTSAIDCGLPVNPLGILAQVESGIIDGLCAASCGQMVFEKGVLANNNFDTYRKLRIADAPKEISIHIMDHGDTEPRGTGETSLPPFIPALTNAIFNATGKRIRSLPITLTLP